MRQLLIATAIVTASVLSGGANQRAGTEAEVRDLVHELTAVYKNDLPKYFSYYAPDGTMWWPSGRVKKEYYQEVTADRGDLASTGVSDLVVLAAPSGDSAIASYMLTLKEKAEGPAQMYQMSLTWFRRGGTWQIVHLHFTPKQ